MIPKLLVSNNQKEIQQYVNVQIQKFAISPFDIFSLGQNASSIKIEQIRELKQKLNLKAWSGTKKTTIIYHAQNLTTEAQNAMLKILEEPVEDTVIFLCTLNENLLLPTIVSRCEIVRIKSEPQVKNQGIFKTTFVETQQMDTGERFKLVEELSTKANKDESLEDVRSRVDGWLTANICEIQHQITVGKIARENLDNLKIILVTQKQIRQNLNIRLVLENYFLNLIKK